MKNNFIIKALLSTTIIFFTFTDVFAADIKVICAEKSDCKQTPNNSPLFLEDNIKPLWSVTKVVEIVNKYNQNRFLTLRIKDIPNNSFNRNDSLAKVLKMKIKEQESGKELWTGSLREMNREKSIRLSDIPKKGSRSYIFEVTMGNVGNEFQAKTVKFDIYLSFKSEKGPENHPIIIENPRNGNVLGGHHIRNIFDFCKRYYLEVMSRYKG